MLIIRADFLFSLHILIYIHSHVANAEALRGARRIFPLCTFQNTTGQSGATPENYRVSGATPEN